MGVLDFLFEGSPPKSVTTTGTTTSAVPQWMQDYTKGLLAKANAEAAMPYQPYEGARIAGFNPNQNAAFDMTKANIGSANPGIEAAMGVAGNLPGQGALQQAMTYLPSSMEEFPAAASRYLNPYQDAVTNKAKNLALDTWNNEINPSISGQFIRNGVYGSSAHMREANQGAAKILSQIQDSADASLAQGWNTSANIFNQDQARQGQLAQIAGQLGATQGNLGMDQAKLLANLGIQKHAVGAQDAAALAEIGQQQQSQTQKNLDLAYQDFLSQQGYTKDQINWLSNLMQGSTGSVPTTTSKAETGPADKYQPSGLSQIASIISAWKGITGDGE